MYLATAKHQQSRRAGLVSNWNWPRSMPPRAWYASPPALSWPCYTLPR